MDDARDWGWDALMWAGRELAGEELHWAPADLGSSRGSTRGSRRVVAVFAAGIRHDCDEPGARPPDVERVIARWSDGPERVVATCPVVPAHERGDAPR